MNRILAVKSKPNSGNFSATLRAYRENLGFTQRHVAEKLGISRSTYTYYEQGKVEPSLQNLVKLARLFKVTVDDLLR